MRLTLIEHLRRQIPIGANTRRSQIDFGLFAIYRLTNAKVNHLYQSSVKEYVCWLEVEVNHLGLLLVQIFHGKYQLSDDLPCLSFFKTACLF